MQQKEVSLDKLLLTVSTLSYLIILGLFSFVTDTNIFIIFVGMLPLLFYLIVFFLLYSEHKLGNKIVWIAPFMFSGLFFAVWLSGKINIVNRMDGPVLAVVNLFLCYLLNIILIFAHRLPAKSGVYQKKAEAHEKEAHELKKRVEEYQQQLKVTKENFRTRLQGIEDKCKAINFAIGRVYSNKHGGSPGIRTRIKLKKELYNSFSELSSHFHDKDAYPLLKLLNQILLSLAVLEQNEQDTFFRKVLSKNNEKIIEILTANDKDPVVEYFEEAKDACIKMIDYLKESYRL
jgi:hypothetical protein